MRRARSIQKILVPAFVAVLLLAAAIVLAPAVSADCGGCGKQAAAQGGHGHGAASGEGCCGMCGGGKGQGKGHGKGRGAGKGMHHGGGQGDHENIHALLDSHDAIQRKVKEVKGGVETVTTSEDPEVTKKIREHVAQMERRMESGQGMRWWDPTFAEIFRNHDKIKMEIEEVPGGVRVRETTDSPELVALIRQHAHRAVSEFVAEGRARAHKPTPLPDGYASVD